MTHHEPGQYYDYDCAPLIPYDDAPAISELQEKVLLLLEEYGVPTDTNDKIVALIEAAERASDEAAQQAAFWEEGE